MKTALCDLLNIKFPIIQAPIGSATCPSLAAAVSNAGGLGTLALSWRAPDAARRMIRETRSLTNRPFGINLVLEWSQIERLHACLDEGVSIVSLFWGDPAPYVKVAHEAGAIVIHAVASAAEAQRAVDAGVNVIVAQGWEAGGHVWGEVGTFALLPRVVDAVSPVPVVAAGGISDGRGLAAALSMGAAGVWVGTRFLASQEAAIHPLYKDKVLEATEVDTTYLTLFDIGWEKAPHRVIRNSTTIEWEAAGRALSPDRPAEGETVAHFADGRIVERYSDVIPLPGMTGNLEALALYAGQGAGLVTDIKPAGDIV